MNAASASQANGPQVPCPVCRRSTRFAPSNPWRPFCSERCRSVDLGAWSSGSYRVEVPDNSSAEEDDGAAAPRRSL